MLLAAAAMVREREHGTVEHLLVSPLRPWELFAAKVVPVVALLALLAGQLPPDTVRTGHRCTGFRQDEASATACFADGSTATADVVIGVDLDGFLWARRRKLPSSAAWNAR